MASSGSPEGLGESLTSQPAADLSRSSFSNSAYLHAVDLSRLLSSLSITEIDSNGL
jgi:hypothetical protein